MKTNGLWMIICFVHFSSTAKQYKHPDIGLNSKQMIQKYGYPFERYSITTEDGYILDTYRIPHGKDNANVTQKHPVLLIPGVICTADVFLTLGPDLSLGFLLADNGYDVWLGNYRGTTWSRKHKFLDPVRDKKQFFDFSFQEIGLYDVTANIDHILNATNHNKLFYIGYSLGTTSFFAMTALRPGYNEKIILMTALAPVMYAFNIQHYLFSFGVQHFSQIKEIVEKNNQYELFSHSPQVTLYGQAFCNDYAVTQPLCAFLIHALAGYSPNLNKAILPVILSYIPAGTATRTILHYFQLAKSKQFEMYDFGEEGNKEKYGQVTPPTFDINKITAPVALYYGAYDALATPPDVELLASVLPNVIKKEKIDGFNHMDFLVAKNIVSALNSDVLQTMKRYT